MAAFFGFSVVTMDVSKSRVPSLPASSMPATSRHEVRCAVRFPIKLPVVLEIGKREFAALTRNISASGVLFDIECPLLVGQNIRFSLRMPSEVLGAPQDVLVHCLGRVVRCCMNQTQYQVAATIDEYQFVEQ
jgi:hypothetical protein